MSIVGARPSELRGELVNKNCRKGGRLFQGS